MCGRDGGEQDPSPHLFKMQLYCEVLTVDMPGFFFMWIIQLVPWKVKPRKEETCFKHRRPTRVSLSPSPVPQLAHTSGRAW